jgi:hypothetical protein
MQQVRIIKKYVTTDGMEFLTLDSANEHQVKIDSIGKSLIIGTPVKAFDKSMGGNFIQFGVIDSIDLPFITLTTGTNSVQEFYLPNMVILPQT